ncbi:hypothetical protein CNECB9_5470014 [Cupriavidus necator]|uniref:Uncharacterized protein n=1 Tax=Cupriavidus necator TaxID=106590 RepID=A0A1K0JKV6_CUPNE|nr:hypothetical protein CNECB9_5470014 [Cupriavidus necator]
MWKFLRYIKDEIFVTLDTASGCLQDGHYEARIGDAGVAFTLAQSQ